MQPRAYGHLAWVITAMCVSLHWINDITGQQERAMQNAFPLSEGPGPVTDQRGLVEVSRGGKELAAELKSRKEMGYKRWTCRGRRVRPGQSRGRRESLEGQSKELGSRLFLRLFPVCRALL